MKTKIFKSYEDFEHRADREMNGVSVEFSKINPDWKKQNLTNRWCWNCIECDRCSGCNECSRCVCCSGCIMCRNCDGCSECHSCNYLVDARCLYHFSNLSHLSSASCVVFSQHKMEVPVIENIHQEVYKRCMVIRDPGLNEYKIVPLIKSRIDAVLDMLGGGADELLKHNHSALLVMKVYHASSKIPIHPSFLFNYKNEKTLLLQMKKYADLEKSEWLPPVKKIKKAKAKKLTKEEISFLNITNAYNS